MVATALHTQCYQKIRHIMQDKKQNQGYSLTCKPPGAPPDPSSFLLSSWFWRFSASMRPRASSSLFSRKSRSSRCFSLHADRPSKRSFIVRLV